MTPVSTVKPQDTSLIQHFLAVPGKRFHFRINLANAPPHSQGMQYGCRVYVDQGGEGISHVYNARCRLTSGRLILKR
eukprot:scaffold3849_cov179-Amphora_coffeaeformis.AAC.14